MDFDLPIKGGFKVSRTPVYESKTCLKFSPSQKIITVLLSRSPSGQVNIFDFNLFSLIIICNLDFV